MDKTIELVRLARIVRAAWETLAKAAESADELKAFGLRDQLFELEVQAIALHSEILEFAKNPSSLAANRKVGQSGQDELPF